VSSPVSGSMFKCPAFISFKIFILFMVRKLSSGDFPQWRHHCGGGHIGGCMTCHSVHCCLVQFLLCSLYYLLWFLYFVVCS